MLAPALLAAACLLALGSCNTSGCLDNQSSIPLAGFYSMSTRRAVALDSLAIYGVGAPGDSILYFDEPRLSQAYLPLRSSASQVSYCFRYMQQALDAPRYVDTLTLTYTPVTYFASEQCGAMYRYHVHSMTHTTHLIDSVALLDTIITNVPSEQIKIFFRTGDEE